MTYFSDDKKPAGIKDAPDDTGTLTKGGIYYSRTLPQGSGRTQASGDTLLFDQNIWDKLKFARTSGAKLTDINAATDLLVDIGYLDEDDPRNYDAGLKDQSWQGAIKRYEYNFPRDTMPLPFDNPFQAVKDWMMNEDRFWNE